MKYGVDIPVHFSVCKSNMQDVQFLQWTCIILSLEKHAYVHLIHFIKAKQKTTRKILFKGRREEEVQSSEHLLSTNYVLVLCQCLDEVFLYLPS